MKKGIHPDNYRLVVFKDMTTGDMFLNRSTCETEDTIEYTDGSEYPLVKLEISYKSHPFFTGKMQFVDTAGRIDKFKNRYKRHLKTASKPAEAAAAPTEEAAASSEEAASTEEA